METPLIRLWRQVGQATNRFFQGVAAHCEDLERASAKHRMRIKQAVRAFLKAFITAGRAIGL